MKIEIIRKEEHITSDWSGGTTTQLYIYPKSSNYKKLDFYFRLSSATVDCDESVFTPLKDIKRDIMVLNGEMDLIHKGQYSVHLNSFEQDRFSGNWETISKGKVTDFNLMTSSSSDGGIQYIGLAKNENTNINTEGSYNMYCLYVYRGDVNIVCDEETFNLKGGDIIIFNLNEKISVSLSGNENCDMVMAKVKCPIL